MLVDIPNPLWKYPTLKSKSFLRFFPPKDKSLFKLSSVPKKYALLPNTGSLLLKLIFAKTKEYTNNKLCWGPKGKYPKLSEIP